MINLDELFRQARKTEAPLSLKEAEALIRGGAAAGGKGANPGSNGSMGGLQQILLGTGIVLTAGLSLFYTLRSGKPEQGTVVNERSTALEKPENRQKAEVIHNPGTIQVDQKDPLPFNRTKEPLPFYANTLLKEKPNENNEQATGKENPEQMPLEMGENSQSGPQTSIGTEETPAKDPEEGPSSGSLKETPADSSLTPKQKTKTLHPAKRTTQFIRSDLLGYFYGIQGSPLNQTEITNTSGLTGGRINLGYERLMWPRISLGVSLSYGFAPLTHKATISGDNVIARRERYDNYKGLTANLEGRYYFGRRANGTGFYAGIYTAFGALEERVYVTREIPGMGEIRRGTVMVSSGTSFGLGLSTGYKIPVGRLFIEPGLGFIVLGQDWKYYNWSYVGQEKQHRYHALNKYEISIGYSF